MDVFVAKAMCPTLGTIFAWRVGNISNIFNLTFIPVSTIPAIFSAVPEAASMALASRSCHKSNSLYFV